MITHQVKSVTTFDLGKMAGTHNNYDNRLSHPMNSEIVFISKDGSSSKLFVGQIATLVAIINEYPNPGAAIDALFKGISPEKVSEICRKF